MSKLKIITVAASCLVLIAAAVWLTGRAPEYREEITISMPYNEYIRSVDTNYYKEWLEEQTGLSIKFNIIYEDLTAGYLRSVFSSGYVNSDAFFSPFGANPEEYNAVLREFGESGYIIPLNAYIEKSVRLNAIFTDFPEYDLRAAMTSADGNIYYMPGFDPSTAETHFQVLWLNQNFLKKLKIEIPQTTEELKSVLYAFKTGDPNGNGEPDEVPLSGSCDVASEQCYNFIINAFVYNDPENSRLFTDAGEILFAPVTSEWREAMQYLNGLYRDGLISPFQFTLDHDALAGLANDPRNILGGFAGQSISDVIFKTNPELTKDFVQIAPVAGPDGVRRTTVRTPVPVPAGIITAQCENPEAVFKLFDLMLSEEAFLIGRYGEENVDWAKSYETDIDIYGNKAAIRVINQLHNTVQSKHLVESGPFFAYPEFADGVTFSGFEADHEYVDARAYRVYEQYKPAAYVRLVLPDGNLQAIRRKIDEYTIKSIKAFTTGEADPFDDTAWDIHLKKYIDMDIEKLIGAAQLAQAD